MKQLLVLFWLQLKTNFKKPAYILLLLLIPVMVYAYTCYSPASVNGHISIGLYCDANDSDTLDIFTDLTNYDGLIKYTIYNDLSSMKAATADNTLNLSYIFPDNICQRIVNNNYDNSIEVILGNNADIIARVSNEVVFSHIFSHCSKYMMSDYVINSDYFNIDDAFFEQELDNYYTMYDSSDAEGVFHVEFKTLDSLKTSYKEALSNNAQLFSVKGLLFILLFAYGLFSQLAFLEEKQHKIFLMFNPICRLFTPFIYSITSLLPISISVLLALIILQTYKPLELLCFVLITSVFCSLLSLVIRNKYVYAAVIPVILLICLLVNPIFIDLSPFFPFIKYFRFRIIF